MTIDNYFFSRLCDQMVHDELDSRSLERFIRSAGVPKYAFNSDRSLLGFVLEAHAKMAFSELSALYPLSQFNGHGFFSMGEEKLEYVSNEWGNVYFYSFRETCLRDGFVFKEGYDHLFQEIDGVYLFDEESPIILEATVAKKTLDAARKIKLVQSLFDRDPYFLKIKMSRHEGEYALMGSSREINGEMYHCRRILLPHDGRYDVIVDNLQRKHPQVITNFSKPDPVPDFSLAFEYTAPF